MEFFTVEQLLGPTGLTVGACIAIVWAVRRIVVLEARIKDKDDAISTAAEKFTECRLENVALKGEVRLWQMQRGFAASPDQGAPASLVPAGPPTSPSSPA